MSAIKKFLPGFRTTCFIVGGLDIFLAGSIHLQGVMNVMAKYKVPADLLASAHYNDAMSWVFLHMIMIGILIIMIGTLAEDAVKKLWAARVLVVMHLVYLISDISTSDNPFGNGLYKGEESVIPVFFDILYVLLFLRLSFGKVSKRSAEVSQV